MQAKVSTWPAFARRTYRAGGLILAPESSSNRQRYVQLEWKDSQDGICLNSVHYDCSVQHVTTWHRVPSKLWEATIGLLDTGYPIHVCLQFFLMLCCGRPPAYIARHNIWTFRYIHQLSIRFGHPQAVSISAHCMGQQASVSVLFS